MKDRIKNININYSKDKEEQKKLERDYTIALSKIIINRIPKDNLKQLIDILSEKNI